MNDQKQKAIRYLPAVSPIVAVNSSNNSAMNVKGISKDSEILGFVIRYKPGLEDVSIEIDCADWNNEKLHNGSIPLPCIGSPWNVEPKEFNIGSPYPLKNNTTLTFKIETKANAVAAGDIVVLVKIREK